MILRKSFTMSKSFFIILFLLNNNITIKNCSDIEKSRIHFLYNEIKTLENDTKFDIKDLFQIIIPEYILFSEKTDFFEKKVIKVYYYSGLDSFKKISIGPFQMNIDFIKNYYTKKKEYNEIIDGLDYYSSLKVQWQILNNYINQNLDLNHRQLINKYNSGSVNSEFEFTKFNNNKSYYEISKTLCDCI